MLLEFPDDESLYTNATATAYQLMLGPWLLAAPVYQPGAVVRDGIYLPGGATSAAWFDCAPRPAPALPTPTHSMVSRSRHTSGGLGRNREANII